MKKVIKGLMLSPLLFVIIFQSLSQADVTLTIEDGFGLPGSYNNPVTVNLTNQFDRIRAIQADICDAVDYLTCTGCETTDRTAGFTCTFNEFANGCVRVVLMDFLGVNFIEPSDDPIFTLKYDILTEAPSGQCDNHTLEGVKVSDESGQPLPSADVTLVSGQFCFFLPPDTDNDSIPDYEDNCPTTPNGPDNGTCTAGDNAGDTCVDNATCGTGGYCSMDQEDSDGDGIGDACEPTFTLIVPANESIVTSPPTLSWSAGTYDLFKVFIVSPIYGTGYYNIPPFWYLDTELPFPSELFNWIIQGYPCFWAVLGVNTVTLDWEVSEVWTFTKVIQP